MHMDSHTCVCRHIFPIWESFSLTNGIILRQIVLFTVVEMMEMCELERKMVTDRKENCLSGLIIMIYSYCHHTKGYNYIFINGCKKNAVNIVCLHSEQQTSCLRTDFLPPTITKYKQLVNAGSEQWTQDYCLCSKIEHTTSRTTIII